MTEVRIKPEMGKEYNLYIQIQRVEENIKAFYIGVNPVKTDFCSKIYYPEGHTFVRMNDKKEFEIYCTRNLDEKLLLMWNSDGEDGPCWPAGFQISKVECELSNLEREYLLEKMQNWSVRKNAA